MADPLTIRDARPNPSAASARPSEPVKRADSFGIVVGIDRYPGFSDLRGACNDAEAFRGWLVDPTGGNVPAGNVRTHLGRKARSVRTARPAIRDIELDLNHLVNAVRRQGRPSRLYLYFAGHGVAPGMGEAAVVMADAQPGLCYNLSLGKYEDWLARCRDFAEVVLFSDCCRSVVLEAQNAAPPHDSCREPGPQSQRVFVAQAAQLGAAALESGRDPSEARGYFTAALLDGLRGQAANERTGMVTAAGLAEFVRVRLPEATGGPQRPDIRGTYDSLVLATVGPTSFPVSIRLTAGPPRTSRVLDEDNAEVASIEHNGGDWLAQLGNGLYELDDPQLEKPLFFRVTGPTVVEA